MVPCPIVAIRSRAHSFSYAACVHAQGGFTKKMLRRCAFADKHFEMHDPNCPFAYLDDDPITKTKVRAAHRV